MSSTSFKVTLIGDAGSGKTAYIRRVREGIFEPAYKPTLGVEVNPLPIFTTQEVVTLNMWDTAGQGAFSGLDEGYLIGGQAVIIALDLGSRLSMRSAFRHYLPKARRVLPNAPIVVIGCKSDVGDSSLAADRLAQACEALKLPHFLVSSKNGTGLEEPLDKVVSLLLGREIVRSRSSPVQIDDVRPLDRVLA